jgi:major membrane immunogen (membrane-anchored lipoprotein)
VGETTWRNSGNTESGIEIGQTTIEFKAISGWTTPTNQSVNITNGGTATATGTYVQQTGALQVTLSPAGAVTAGAQWRRVGETTWRNSGDTESGIAVGQATIEFKTISGWTTPTNQSVNITNGGTATATGIYGQQTGALQVTLSPAGAVTAGAQWRRAGQPAWRNSGNTESGIAIGQATIEFKTISGWTAPSNQIVNITNGGTATATGIYGQQTGALQVTLSPAGAVTAGAQWRRAGQPAWRNSGETESSIPVGEYTLEFKDAAGWNTPSTQAINIVSGGTVTATGLYTQQAGSLRVTLAPEAAIAAGARWRRSGTTTWLSSGYTEGSIPAGQYRVEFKAVSQWMTPPGKTVNIVTGELVQATATYTQNDCVGDTIVLWMPDRTVHPGAEVLIPVNVNSAEVISPEGMEIHVTYDPAFLNTESISVQSTGITGKMCLLWNLPEEGRIVISAVGNLQGLRLSGQGHLFDIYGRLRDGLEEGACSTVRFEDVAFFDGEVRPLCLDATDTARLCAGATNRLGDINNDGANNVGDALFALRLAVHLEAREDRHITTGDMNGDNAIDSADALMLQRLSVLGFKSINPDMPDPGNGVSDPLLLSNILAAGIPITIKAEDEQGRVGEDVEIPVRVDNANGLCGYDINLTYPQDILTVKDVRPGTLVGTSPQRWRDDADNGLINISMGRQEAVYDQSKNAIPGTLATVVFTIKAKPATGDLATVRISGTPDLKGQYGDSFGWYTALFKDNGEIRVLPAAGSLQVTLAPQGAVNAGAQWQRVGQSAWRNSGATESNIPPGQVTVECSHVTGWDTPAQQDVTISSGQVATLTRTYVSSAGALQVTLAPQDAINAGAQWRRVGQSAWRNSGAAESGLAPGQYTVEFLTVTDWTTPAAQTISVVAGQTATLTGTYVYVEPAVTVQAQALLDGFGPADGDSNGSLSLGEARTVRPYLSDATFAALDANGDGGITQAELDAYLNPGPGGCDGCLGGKGAFPWADWKRFLGDLMLLGVSLAVLLAMGRGHAARR